MGSEGRREPDLDEVREAMREHDERAEQNAQHEPAPEPPEDEDEEDAGAPS